MKVVLLQDIKGLGVRGDIRSVSDGYAMNFLIPNKKAISDMDGEGKSVVHQKAVRDQRRASEGSTLQTLLEQVPDTVVLHVPANEQGTLFSAVTESTLSTYLQETHAITLPIECFSPIAIKTVGTHTVVARHGETEKSITVTIEHAIDGKAGV